MPSQLPLQRHARSGFTMIELLTVIAIIGILSGIVVVAYKHVGVKAQERQTRTYLESLRNATSELTLNKASEKAFFEITIPSIYRDPAAPTTGSWDAVPAASADSLTYTKRVLLKIQANPKASAMLKDIPTERVRREQVKTSDASTDPARDVSVPLDAWDKPILFVYDNWQTPKSDGASVARLNANGQPTGGLTDLYSDSAKTYWQTTPIVAVRDVPYAFTVDRSKAPRNTYTKQADAVRSPDRRPFWVSAGPDGKFETHDDNVYSFEN